MRISRVLQCTALLVTTCTAVLETIPPTHPILRRPGLEKKSPLASKVDRNSPRADNSPVSGPPNSANHPANFPRSKGDKNPPKGDKNPRSRVDRNPQRSDNSPTSGPPNSANHPADFPRSKGNKDPHKGDKNPPRSDNSPVSGPPNNANHPVNFPRSKVDKNPPRSDNSPTSGPPNSANHPANFPRSKGDKNPRSKGDKDPHKGDKNPRANTPEYTYNWSGAELHAPPTGELFQSVTGTVKLPELKVPTDVNSTDYFFYVWVGLDGDSCSSLWQTGLAGQINSGVPSWWGWIAWIGDPLTFYQIPFNASTGDTVNMTVQALNTTEGVFWLENMSTGQGQSYNVSGQALCLQNAEWIVEDPYYTDSAGNTDFTVWPDYGTLVFENAVAYTNKGTAVTPVNANLVYVEAYYGGYVENSVAVTDSTVSVTWEASAPCCSVAS